MIVNADEAGAIARTTGATKELVSEQHLAERLSWAQSELVFYNEELQSVVDEVVRYTTIAR